MADNQFRQARLLHKDYCLWIFCVDLSWCCLPWHLQVCMIIYMNIHKEQAFNFFIRQFVHHPWNGLHFWDLIQPAFMFMAGTAMAFSLTKQWSNGVTWKQSFKKILKRCGWLFFWGVLDYAVRPARISFELWDILTQLSFTTLVAFLIFRWSALAQIMVCVGLLLLTEILYRYTNVPGFDQPFTDQHNFGNYMDTVLMNKINRDGWVAINCIPTAVHTIAGALAGKLLLSDRKKIQPLLLWGLVCLLWVLDWIMEVLLRLSKELQPAHLRLLH